MNDFKALAGDPSDNIPGAPGVGEKTAIELIKNFGTVENLYQELEQKSEKTKELKPKLKEILLQSKEQVFFSKELSKIKKDVPIDFQLRKKSWREYNKGEVVQMLEDLEFYSLIGRLPEAKN